MQVVIQRVSSSNVKVDGKIIGEIGRGLNVLLGVAKEDTKEDAEYILNKIINMRIFEDDMGKMNLSLLDIGGDLLVISQFTLLANTKKGKRPSFEKAGDPIHANELYEYFIEIAKKSVKKVEHGKFGADMKVDIQNDGPVTILLNSEK